MEKIDISKYNLNPEETKTLENYSDFLNSKEVFNIEIPQEITTRDFVGLSYLLVVLETAIAQIPSNPNIKTIPVFHSESELPYGKGIDFVSRENIFDRINSSIGDLLLDQLLILCKASRNKIQKALEPLEGKMRLIIDPECLLQTTIEWDIYLFYLNHFDFGFPAYAKRTSHRGSDLSLGSLKYALSCRYPQADLDAALAVNANLIARRIVLLDIGHLRGKWDDLDFLLSDYTRRTFNRPFADQSTKVSEEIIPKNSFGDLLLKDEVVREIQALCDYQKTCSAKSLTFLFSGPSGVGKTTLAHSIANHMQKKILRIRVSAKSSNLETYMKYFCEQAKNQDFILLFDEADCIFRESMEEENVAGWARILFEEFKGIAIFTTNYSLPYGFDRRMTYTLQVKDLTTKQKATLIKSLSEKEGYWLRENECRDLAAINVSPGYYENIFRLASALEGKIKSFDILKKSFIQRASYLLEESEIEKYQKLKTIPDSLFFSDELDNKIKPLRLGLLKYQQDSSGFPRGLKAIFSGPPGTGKTAIAGTLAYELGLEMQVITPSEIFAPYVGQNEKNVRRIFAKPGKEEPPKVLFLDEVESLLVDRNFAHKTWELSLTNELLTRLDSYPGIVIAATNRYDLLDPAFKRRFLFHIEFCVPDEETRRKIWYSRAPMLSQDAVNELAKFKLTGADISDICFKVCSFYGADIEKLKSECCEVIAARHPSERLITLF